MKKTKCTVADSSVLLSDKVHKLQLLLFKLRGKYSTGPGFCSHRSIQYIQLKYLALGSMRHNYS